MAFAKSPFTACHIFHGMLPLFKDLAPALQNGTNTHWFFTHFGTKINILCMQIIPMRIPTSVEGIVVNFSHYSTWIIIIAPYLALPHKPETWQCLPLLHKPTEIVMKQSICSVLFQLKHSRSWGVCFIRHRNNATRSLCLNDTSLHHITVQSWNLVCIT